MRTEEEIRTRIQELTFVETSRRLQRASERLPHLCTHNYRHPLDARKRSNGDPNPGYNRITDERSLPVVQTVGLCSLDSEDPATWNGTICEEPLDAKRCPYFKAAKSETEVTQELEAQMQDPEWVKAELPEVYALLWVLGEITTPKLRWWQRLLLWWHRPRLEELSPPFDSTKLLPPTSESVSSMS